MEMVQKLQFVSLDDLYFRKPVRQHIRQFGQIMAIAALIIAFLLYRKGHGLDLIFGLGVLSVVFLFLGTLLPQILYPVWKSWMLLGGLLGVVMSTIVLFVGWWIAMVPVAIGMRFFKKRVLETGFRDGCATYWLERDPKLNDFQLLKRQR